MSDQTISPEDQRKARQAAGRSFPPRAEFEAVAVFGSVPVGVRVVVRRTGDRWTMTHRIDLADKPSQIKAQAARWDRVCRDLAGGGPSGICRMEVEALKIGRGLRAFAWRTGKRPMAVKFYRGIQSDELGKPAGKVIPVRDLFDDGKPPGSAAPTVRRTTGGDLAPSGRGGGSKASKGSRKAPAAPKAPKATKTRKTAPKASGGGSKASKGSRKAPAAAKAPKATKARKTAPKVARGPFVAPRDPKGKTQEVTAYARRRGRPTDRDREGRWTFRRGRG